MVTFPYCRHPTIQYLLGQSQQALIQIHSGGTCIYQRCAPLPKFETATTTFATLAVETTTYRYYRMERKMYHILNLNKTMSIYDN